MNKYRVIVTQGFDWQGLHYDYLALVYMKQEDAIEFLGQGLIQLEELGDPAKSTLLPFDDTPSP